MESLCFHEAAAIVQRYRSDGTLVRAIGARIPHSETLCLNTVLVAAENPILRVGLETILEDAEDCRPVGRASTVQEVRDQVARLRPDVVLLDIALRRKDEFLVPELAKEYPRTRTLMLVDHSEEECALRYFLSGSGKARLSGEALEILDDCCLVFPARLRVGLCAELSRAGEDSEGDSRRHLRRDRGGSVAGRRPEPGERKVSPAQTSRRSTRDRPRVGGDLARGRGAEQQGGGEAARHPGADG